MDPHPKMRIQFWLADPFDPLEDLSVTFYDDEGAPDGCIVRSGRAPQHELWAEIARLASEHLLRYGTQLKLLD